jgi:hypothetical protein
MITENGYVSIFLYQFRIKFLERRMKYNAAAQPSHVRKAQWAILPSALQKRT